MSEKAFPVILYPNEQPHKYQKALHYWASQPEIKTITLVLPRQNGKSTALRNEVIRQMIDPFPRHGKKSIKVLWTTPVESQGVATYEMLLLALSPLVKSSKQTHGQFEIVLKNNSKISFKPSSSKGIRSMTIDLLIVDEMQDVTPDEMRISINPILLANKNALTIVAGTPDLGLSNILYDYYRRETLYPDLGFKTIHCTVNDIYTDYPNPRIDLNKVLAEKATMPADMFDAVYRGFWKSTKAYFHNVREQAVVTEQFAPTEGISYFAGIDVGIINDKTVISIVNEYAEQVSVKVLSSNLLFPDIVKEIQKLNQIWNFKFICLEKNNQGLPLYHSLISTNLPIYNIEAVDMQANRKGDHMNKAELVNFIESKLQSKEIKLLNRADVIEEMELYECKRSKSTGTLKWSAPSGKHDDIVIATILSFYCLDKHNKNGEYHYAVI